MCIQLCKEGVLNKKVIDCVYHLFRNRLSILKFYKLLFNYIIAESPIVKN